MKKIKFGVIGVLCCVALTLPLASCQTKDGDGLANSQQQVTPPKDGDGLENSQQQVTPTKLGSVALSLKRNVASWDEVAYASRYAYQINDGEVVETTLREVTLQAGDTIKVKAIGEGAYSDGDFCAPITYNAPLYDGEINDGPVVVTLNALDDLSSATAVAGASKVSFIDVYAKSQGEASYRAQYTKQVSVEIPMRRNGQPLTREKLALFDEIRLDVYVPGDSTYSGAVPSFAIGSQTFASSIMRDGWNELVLDVDTLIEEGFISYITVDVSQARTGDYSVGFDALSGVYNEKLDLGNVMIFGDSYSTFDGYLHDNRFYYYAEKPVAATDVTKVEETWWGQVLSNTDSNLIMNNSVSGSTVCGTTYGTTAAPQDSFVERIDELIANGYFEENTVDTIFLFGGTNDSWGVSPLGEAKYSGWTQEDKNQVLPSYCYFISKALEHAPNAKIVVLLNTYENLRDSLIAYYKPTPIDYQTPIINAVKGFEEYGSRIQIVALSDHDHNDINLIGLHPTVSGGAAIKDQILNILYERKYLPSSAWTLPDYAPMPEVENTQSTADLLNGCEVSTAFETNGVTGLTASTNHVVEGEKSVTGTMNGWSTWLAYLVRRGKVPTLQEIAKYDYIELTVYAESTGVLYMNSVEIHSLTAGVNVVRLDSERFIEIAQAWNGEGLKAYDEVSGYLHLNVWTIGSVWFDNIRGVYPVA